MVCAPSVTQCASERTHAGHFIPFLDFLFDGRQAVGAYGRITNFDGTLVLREKL